MICAIIITVGVYRISKKPSGPDLLKIIYNARPTNTGGRPIKELTSNINIFYPINSLTLKYAAIGSPKKQEINKAEMETKIESETISDNSEFKLKINKNELINI